MAERLSGSLADSEQKVFWLDSPEAPEPLPPLEGETSCELAIVGGGFTGLWAALLAAPDEDVLLLEGARCGWAASGRNGGFLDASLTHGLENGLARWPGEMERLTTLGDENFDAIRDTLATRGIDAAWEENGFIDVATRAHEVEELAEGGKVARRHGHEVELLDRAAVRARVDSPTYLAGLYTRTGGGALVDPARLAWGLRRAALEDGVRIHEGTQVTAMRRDGDGVLLETPGGRVRASRIVLATNAFKPLVRSIGRYVIPVYDYVLVSEPLDQERRAAVGWERREGLADSGNRFHYYRLTDGDRILWGGYEAVYHWANGMRPELEESAAVFNLLAHNFFETFPQLEGLRFTHRWAGAIDTSSRFCVTFGTALGGRAAYAVGYTGLGVGATRFGARVALDLVHGRDTELTRLELVRSRPIPFPPEPLRFAVVQATRRALIRADERRGRRGPWLRLLDRMGAGFDS
jgi:glycine/D-amino acid oxidase-like deaminating enzyme